MRQLHRLSSLTSGRFSLRLLLHGRDLALAIGNHRQSSDNHTFSLGTPQTRLDLLAVPNHIHLKAFPFPLTQTIHACTLEPDLGIATGTKERKYSPLSLAHPFREKTPLALPATSQQKTPEEGDMLTKRQSSTAQPRAQPKAQWRDSQSPIERQPKPTEHQDPTVQPRTQPKSATLPSLQMRLTRLQPVDPLCYLLATQSFGQANAPTQFAAALDLQSDKPNNHSFLLAKDSLLPIELPVPPPQALSPAPLQRTEQRSRPKMRARKGELQATRRSDRLHQRQSSSLPQLHEKGNSSTKKIDFNLQSSSHDTPLEVSSVLHILQVTGVEITDQIEEMIDEALKQDQQAEPSRLSMPTTPLHDIIPPLALPGEDLLL